MNGIGNDIHALSGAYAVDAVDPEERVEFERHLGECAACRAEVDSLREAAGLLAGTAETEPPASVRDAVLRDIRTVRPLPPVTTPRHSSKQSDRDPGSRRRRWAPALAAAAAVLAVVGGVGTAITQPWQDESSQAPTAIERVEQADDATEVTLELDGGASATVVYSRSLGRATITTEDMPPAPPGKVYELWYQTPEGTMVPAGLMPNAQDQTVLLEGDAPEAQAVGITVEPDGGSPAPTSAPIALFDLTRGA